ncbi:uncharacterized protein DUF429 [Aquabacterium commune]|uniref:Uncharacterized protein DUF429 n=1 Tax=Aquabacterium commune TaxID=70586 RepID=A0A4R6RHF5_9BURK|nr:DUF429 domain-containing protein [Aquabacterium commune]TDP85752.1 uncharacterized protein DUF429 [Aquabacterium commune]
MLSAPSATAPSALPATLLGLDFSCAPSARKPLTLAWGRRAGGVVRLDRVDELPTLAALEAVLAPGASHTGGTSGFIAACDFPFGLPRPFVQALQRHGPGTLPADLDGPACDAAGAPLEAERLVRALHRHCVDRAGFQRLIDGWGDAWHPERTTAHPGSKLLHRATDQAMPGVSSTSPLQTRYVPVGKMYFEGMRRLVDANFTLPGLRAGRTNAIALEAYPGLLASELLGRRSYKSDAKANTPAEVSAQQARLIARMDLLNALEQGRSQRLAGAQGLRLQLSAAQRDHLLSDPKGDRLDAVLCLMQAAWAQRQREEGNAHWGLPPTLDPVEGWILSA